MSSDIQVDLLKRRQQHETFLKCFKDHLLELQFPSDEELKAAKEGGGQLGSKLMKLAQNRDLHHTDMSENYGLDNEQNRDRYKKKNYLNLFQVERGPCRICSQKDTKCPFYRACFNIETFRGIELFSCLNCGCPMNSHVILQSDYNFSNSICSQVNRRYINESHLQFKACVSIFFVDANTAKDFKIDIESFITSLNEAGFNALSFYEMDIATLQKIWLEKSLYSKKSNIKAQEFQQYFQFFGTFLEMIAKFGVADKFALQDCLQNPDDIKILEFYLKRLDKVNQKLGLAYQRNKIAFIFLISGNQLQLQVDYKKFLFAAKSQIQYLHTDYKKYLLEEIKYSDSSYQPSDRIKTNSTQDLFYTQQQQQQFQEFQSKLSQRSQDMIYYYSSSTKNKAIRDTLLFFPQFYKLNVVSFLLTQQVDEIHNDRRKMNDTFMDMLDFNNISIFKQDFGQVLQRTLNEAFKFIPNQERFLKSIQFDGSGVNIKIGYKIGTQQLNIMSQNLPNYYKISQPTQNQTLCDRLCPEIFYNQRILIIYRPIVIKSNLSGLLNNVWKLNDFIEIDSDYVRLSLQEARMLAQIEKIHPQNLNNYLTMMTEGYSQVVLYARPGAYQGAKIISDGSKTGLKVRQSKKLQELQIQHQAKTGQFVEKLPMNFHNFFEQFTSQNIFLSIKDLFNLEELVLQENTTKINKNIFVNEDDHVFLVPNQADQTGISQQVKLQLIRDLPKENYNYYLYTSSDEIITEQLASLFIPECTQIEHIYLIIKPVLQNTKDSVIDDIKQLVSRMKFSIFDCKQLTLSDEELAKLINLITPYKLNKQDLQIYVTEYKQAPLYMLSLMKQAGMKEMKNFLTGFNFSVPTYTKPQLIHEIKPYLIPCLNYEIIRFISAQFNNGFYKFDAQTFEQDSMNEQLLYLLRYILAYSVGVNMDNECEKLVQESTLRHTNFKVSSVSHGDFEIRIRSMHDQIKYTKAFELQQDYELQSWYYMKINSLFPQRAPVVYQYRILFPERIECGEIDQVFDCQEYPGRNFLLEIYRQVFDFGYSVFEALKSEKLKHVEEKFSKTQKEIQKKVVKTFEDQMSRVSQYMDKRSKMIAYFWGIKLAKFTKELELINSDDEFPNGFGDIIRKENGYECKYKIKTPEYDHISYLYKKHYKQVFENINTYISEKLESDANFHEELNQMQSSNFEFGQSQLFSQIDQKRDMSKTNVERRLTRFFNSILPNDQCCELLKVNMNEFKIIPNNLQLQQIRIQNEREQIKTQQFDNQTTFFDWNHEANEQKRKKEEGQSLITPYCNYVLSHCLPIVGSQYELAANVLYLLLVELKQLKFYDKFIDLQILQEDVHFKMSKSKKMVFTSKTDKIKTQLSEMSKMDYFDWFKNNFQIDKQETIDQIIKGFKDSYFINENMVQQMQQIYKEQQYNKKKQMPDLLYMFLYLKCLDEMDKYINLHRQVKERMAALSKKSLKMEQYFSQTEGHLDTQKQDNTMRYSEIEQLKNEQRQYEFCIKTILVYISSDEFQKEFYFDSEQAELKSNQVKIKELKFNLEYYSHYMQNNLTHYDSEEREAEIQDQITKYFGFKQDNNQQKEFIESKRYFQPLEQGNNKNEWGKLDQETIDERMQELEKKRRDELILKIQENDTKIPYLKDYIKDDIQSKWVEGMAAQQGRFVDARPDNQKTGIYVDTVKTVEKKLDEKIDQVIKKFMQDKMNNFNKKQ
ncbi:unnamed protein product [Paramecium octaurelia]|uniref:Uncharacterized protein n=1 Tax=Paramecium octaurelia TaxID=43137 RepID=A0A8S1SC55_PAROT|nr:unnamed protein product [Paramecium octaurelia]